MPIKHEWVLKTIVNSSENIEPTETLYSKLKALRVDAASIIETMDVSFEILVKMENNAITINELYMEGNLTDVQKRIANELHVESTGIISQSAGPGGRIKLEFILKS
jgi:hypothetical protein